MKTQTLTLMLLLAGCGQQALPSDDDLETQSAGAKATTSSSTVQLPGKGGGGGGGTTSTTVCGSNASPTLDQSQLSAASLGRLGPGESVGQTIMVGKTGLLSAVEVSVSYCNFNDTKAGLKLQVLDASNLPLAEAHIGAGNLPHSCSALPLSSSKTGAALFDLSTACLPVTAGEQISILVTAENLTAGTCDFNLGCTSGPHVGAVCNEDADCASADLRASMGFDSYHTGFASMDGAGYAVYDLAFKTTVR